MNNNSQFSILNPQLKKIRRSANIGLYGSIGIVLLTVVIHYCPYRVSPQSPEVARWMLISGVVLAVLAIAMSLMTIRKSVPRIPERADGGKNQCLCRVYP